MNMSLEMEMAELANVIHMLTVRYVVGEITQTDHKKTLAVLLNTYDELRSEESCVQLHCN